MIRSVVFPDTTSRGAPPHTSWLTHSDALIWLINIQYPHLIKPLFDKVLILCELWITHDVRKFKRSCSINSIIFFLQIWNRLWSSHLKIRLKTTDWAFKWRCWLRPPRMHCCSRRTVSMTDVLIQPADRAQGRRAHRLKETCLCWTDTWAQSRRAFWVMMEPRLQRLCFQTADRTWTCCWSGNTVS